MESDRAPKKEDNSIQREERIIIKKKKKKKKTSSPISLFYLFLNFARWLYGSKSRL